MKPLQVKAARLALGMNQRQFAEALRVGSEAVIRSWESGRRPISGPATLAIELLLERGCPKCAKNGEDCGEHSASWQDLAEYWRDRALKSEQPKPDLVEVPFAYCCAQGGGRVHECDCVNPQHGIAVVPAKDAKVFEGKE